MNLAVDHAVPLVRGPGVVEDEDAARHPRGLVHEHLRAAEHFIETLEGSFSAVWIATIASKDAFCSMFQNLHYLHSFAPLQSKNKIS